MKLLKTALLTGLMAALAVSQSQATVIVTYAEQPGIIESTFINAATYDFNNLSTGKHTNVAWNGVGVFDQLYILKADIYGGAENSKYSVQGVGTSVSATILNLDTPSSYFGLWWSAGDATNVMRFYSGANGTGTLRAEFTTASLIETLGSAYYGNPNAGKFYGKDAGEPFAFINFFATPGAAWSSVVLTNSSGSGFESDNYASRAAVYDPTTDGPMPGIVLTALNGKEVVSLVPEANTSLAMAFLGGLSVTGSLIRRFRKKK